MSEKTKHSEPLLRISKRDGLIWWKSWLVRAAAGCAGACTVFRYYNSYYGV